MRRREPRYRAAAPRHPAPPWPNPGGRCRRHKFGAGGAHLLDQQVAHPAGDAGDANADCHVIPPRFDAAILLASRSNAEAEFRLRHGVPAHLARHTAVQASPKRRPGASSAVADRPTTSSRLCSTCRSSSCNPASAIICARRCRSCRHIRRASCSGFDCNGRADQRTITLRHDDAFLSAEPNGDRVSLVQGARPGGWETFLPLSPRPISTPCAASWRPRG